jgi:hypothetical protein
MKNSGIVKTSDDIYTEVYKRISIVLDMSIFDRELPVC